MKLWQFTEASRIIVTMEDNTELWVLGTLLVIIIDARVLRVKAWETVKGGTEIYSVYNIDNKASNCFGDKE